MVYCFRKNEAIGHAVKRVFAEEIGWAAGQLAHSKKRAQAVHDARKSIKKIRGLLSLVESRLGALYKTEDRYFRHAGSQLAELRDSAVTLEVFDKLAAKLKEGSAAGLGEIRLNLQRTQREAQPEKQVSAQVVVLLNQARSHVHSWPLDHLGLDDLLADLTATYRAGRKALKHALHDASAEPLHDFRKEVKQHWYQVRLLESVWSGALKKRSDELRELETWLGDEHNLAVLRGRLCGDSETQGDREQAREFVGLLDEEAQALRRRALDAGQKLYAEKAGAFYERLEVRRGPVKRGPASVALRVRSAVA